MENKKTITAACFTLLYMAALAGGADDSLITKCSPQFQKVTQCLPFVTAKAPTPTKDCCTSIADLKDSNPTCLCFILQQIHNGSNAAVKSMGVQESRLLQLPSACRLANATISDCPGLLHLPPNSPDAAIFTNASSAATSTPGVATPEGGSSSTVPSDGVHHGLSVVAAVLTIFFFHAFS